MSQDLLHELELELAPLFLSGSPQNARFIHTLNGLLRKFPELLEYGLEVPKEQGETHFLIIFFQKVFYFTLVYQHRAYNPWYPETDQQLELAQKLLELHFPASASRLVGVFTSLLKWDGYQPAATDSYKGDPGEAPQRESPYRKNKSGPGIPMTMEEPGVSENALQHIWAASRSVKDTDWPSQFRGGFSSSSRGVVDSMRASFKLWSTFRNSESLTCVTPAGDKLRPWMRLVRVVIGAEYYWQCNKRSVEAEPGVTLQEATGVQLDHIHRIYEEFLRLLPEDHEATWEENRRSWRVERIRGTKQASRVICRYIDKDKAYNIECSQNNILAKEIRLASQRKEQEEEVRKFEDEIITQVSIINEDDPGIRDDILAGLFSSQGDEVQWPQDLFPNDLYPWFKAMLPSLKASWNLYSGFMKSSTRSREVAGYRIQPHHRIIRLLCAAEYYWQFNSRDVELSEKMGFHEIRDLHNFNVRHLVEVFLKAVPEKHSWKQTEEAKLGGGTWKIEKIRGSRRAPRVLLKYQDDLGKWMMEITGTSVNIKKIDKSTE